jgi:hypothetical protein
MTNPYGPPGGHPRPWGQQPQGPGAHPGGMAGPGYGQHGGYVQQPYGAPPGYGQYAYAPHQGGYGAPPGFGPPPQPRRKSRLPWILATLIGLVIVAIVLVTGFVTPGLLIRTVFDANSVQRGVQQILEQSYRFGNVQSVTCPRDEPVERSRTFDCQVDLGGQNKSVTVTVKDTKGVYEVGYPK